MIILKLLLIPLFIFVVFGVLSLGKVLFKIADSMEIDEKKKDIIHKAELVEDVEEYVGSNSDVIKKASSDSVDKFVEK